MGSTSNEGKLVRVVLFPRYTTFAAQGGTEFETLPLDLAAFDTARITLWHAPMNGTVNPTTTFFFDESTERNTWTNCEDTPFQGRVIGPDNEVVEAFPFRRKWFRLRVRIDGANPAVTCFAVGVFVKRQR